MRTTREVRVVFEAAAPFHRRSLNDALLTRLTLQTQLPQILMKFLEGKIFFTVDIQALFNRIRLRPECSLSSISLAGKVKLPVPSTPDRLMFGDRCSPLIAISVIRRVADDFGCGDPETIQAIKRNLYMDDYLDSVDSWRI